MLNEHGIQHIYREYTRNPLTEDELRGVFEKLGLTPREALRTRDAKKEGLPDDITNEDLIRHMAKNPKLLQRPIGILGNRAVIGRPPEALLSLFDERA